MRQNTVLRNNFPNLSKRTTKIWPYFLLTYEDLLKNIAVNLYCVKSTVIEQALESENIYDVYSEGSEGFLSQFSSFPPVKCLNNI